jgi:hypothetical protein
MCHWAGCRLCEPRGFVGFLGRLLLLRMCLEALDGLVCGVENKWTNIRVFHGYTVEMFLGWVVAEYLRVCGVVVSKLYSFGQNNHQIVSLAQPSYFSPVTAPSLHTQFYMSWIWHTHTVLKVTLVSVLQNNYVLEWTHICSTSAFHCCPTTWQVFQAQSNITAANNRT